MHAGLNLGGTAGQLPGMSTYKGGCNVKGTVGNKTLVNPGSSHANKISPKFTSNLGTRLKKMFASPILGRKI